MCAAQETLSENYFTPTEVAEKLRVRRATVWEWIRLGKIKAVGGHRRLIPSSELVRLLQTRTTVTTPANER